MIFHSKAIHLSSFMSLNIEVFTMVKHHLTKKKKKINVLFLVINTDPNQL